jgi:LysM repeat protein
VLRPVLGDPGRSETIPRPRRTPTTTTTAAPPASYRVRRGDTLTNIARQFHTSVQAIMTTNQLADPDHLTEGQQLVMPPPGTVRLDAALAGTGSSQVVRLTMTGADPGELVTFVVTLPTGETFTGTPHAASATGEVSADYTAELLHGTYHVTGTGERGTTAETAFHLVRSD